MPVHKAEGAEVATAKVTASSPRDSDGDEEESDESEARSLSDSVRRYIDEVKEVLEKEDKEDGDNSSFEIVEFTRQDSDDTGA